MTNRELSVRVEVRGPGGESCRGRRVCGPAGAICGALDPVSSAQRQPCCVHSHHGVARQSPFPPQCGSLDLWLSRKFQTWARGWAWSVYSVIQFHRIVVSRTWRQDLA
jgi:hypothetical protein